MERKEELKVLIKEARRRVRDTASQVFLIDEPQDETYIKNLDKEVEILHRYIVEYKTLA